MQQEEKDKNKTTDGGKPAELTDWQKMILQKQRDVIQWSNNQYTTVNTDLMDLLQQSMELGEERGKTTYQDFLDKWKQVQEHPPNKTQTKNVTSQPSNQQQNQTPSEWQKKMLVKQQEVIQTAQKNNITVPQSLIDLWNQAIIRGEKDGQKYYDQFLDEWNKIEVNHNNTKPQNNPNIQPNQNEMNYIPQNPYNNPNYQGQYGGQNPQYPYGQNYPNYQGNPSYPQYQGSQGYPQGGQGQYPQNQYNPNYQNQYNNPNYRQNTNPPMYIPQPSNNQGGYQSTPTSNPTSNPINTPPMNSPSNFLI